MYDVVVIGGGPGGYAAAIRASQLGGKVALAEGDQIGGTCVNRGCIPTKVWQRSARLLHDMRTADEFGIKAAIETVDVNAIVARKNGVANDIRMGMEGLLANNHVDVFKSYARVKSPTEVSIDGTILETRKIIIATGSCLDIPGIQGLEETALTTNEILDVNRIPDSLLVLGSNPIAVEIANTFAILGSKVHLATELPRILPQEDHETSQRVSQALREQGVDLIVRQRMASVTESAKGYAAEFTGAKERTLEVETILVTTRKPNTAHLGLEQLGVQVNEDGAIAVNDGLEASVPGIFAVGDATGGWMFSHAASSMAITAAENAMGQAITFPFHIIPRGMWTIPEVGSVGLSEEEAEKKGYDVEIGNFPYSINGLAMARDEMAGAVKIVSETKFGAILGVHIVGAAATELIGEAALAMQLESTVKELTRSIRVHPTYSESVVDAGRDTLNWALYLPRS